MTDVAVGIALEDLRRRLDAELLTPYVRRALGREEVEIVHSTCEPVHGGSGQLFGAQGVFHLYGEAQAGSLRLPWRLILKIVAPTSAEESAASSEYWKREVLAYQTGLLAALPGNLRAPACYGVTEWPARTAHAEHAEQPESAWLWLEEIPQDHKPPWTPARLQHVARALGHFNGAYLGQDLRQTYPWLGQGRVQEWVDLSEPVLRDLEHYRQDPFVATWISPDSARRLHTLWQTRETLLTPFRRLPRTLCHHDAFVRNLLLESTVTGERVVAIDWSYAGMGALGEEIAMLVGASYTFLDLDVADIQVVEEYVWAGYLAGLHDAGWQGDVQAVRFGYAAASGLLGTIGWVGVLMPIIVEQLDAIAGMLGHSKAEMAAAWPQLLRHRLDLGEEAHTLLEKL